MPADTAEPLSDPKAMRALAHPARLAILDRVRIERTVTATSVAESVGVSPSAASYHLRMLAKYGFVEDAPASEDGRERVWRAAQTGVTINPQPDDSPEVEAAKQLLIRATLDQHDEERSRALRNYPRESPEWREAVMYHRALLLLDASEMRRLSEQIHELLDPYRVANRDPESAPSGARVSEAQISLFPRAPRDQG